MQKKITSKISTFTILGLRVGPDITKNCLNMFPQSPVFFFFNNYPEIFSKYLKKFHFINNTTLCI